MSNITLIMTRKPLEEVDFHGNGRWGRMVVLKGARIRSAQTTSIVDLPDIFSYGVPAGMLGAMVNLGSTVAAAALGKTCIRIGHQAFALDTDGEVEVVGRFDTLERFRTDSNRSKYYVQLEPRPIKPYEIRMDISKRVKKVNTTGQCFRVHGHSTSSQNGGTAGILIHEAPHPGWLIGCIAPREVDNKIANHNHGPSRRAMDSLFTLLGGFSVGRKAELLVMDW